MSVVDAEVIKDDASNGSNKHEFQPLSEEEKQQFLRLADNNAGRLFVEETDQAANSVEQNISEDEVSAGRELLLLPASEQPLVPLIESSHYRETIRNLDVCTGQIAPSGPEQNRSVVLRVIVPVLVSVIVFFLVLNFYPLKRSWMPTSTNQAHELGAATSNPLTIPTAIPNSLPKIAESTVLEGPVQSDVEVPPAPRDTASQKSSDQPPPQVSSTVKPAAHTMRGQAKRKPGHQQRVTQVTEPSWLMEPSWSRDADSFIRFLYFGRVK